MTKGRKKMSDSIRIFLALVVLTVAFFGEGILNSLKNIDINVPVVNVDDPSLENKELVKRIVEIDFKEEDAKLVSAYFIELADVVRNDSSVLKSTESFANFNLMSGILHFDSSFADKYEDLGESVEYAVQNSIGLENEQLTDSKRKELADILEAIAWSVNQ
jgi:hypothetical protein